MHDVHGDSTWEVPWLESEDLTWGCALVEPLSRLVLPIGNGHGQRCEGVGRARGKWQLLLASS